MKKKPLKAKIIHERAQGVYKKFKEGFDKGLTRYCSDITVVMSSEVRES